VFTLPAPARHFHCIRAMAAAGEDDPCGPGHTQGFVLDDGRFVDRKEAGRIADANGQAHRTVGSRVGGMLFSEDLW
jgi:hypothetical protein